MTIKEQLKTLNISKDQQAILDKAVEWKATANYCGKNGDSKGYTDLLQKVYASVEILELFNAYIDWMSIIIDLAKEE